MYEVTRGGDSLFGYPNFGSQTVDNPSLCDENEVAAQTTTSEHAQLLGESEWVACGRRIRKQASKQGKTQGASSIVLDPSCEIACSEFGTDVGTIELSLQLCDPMRRKRNALKPSLTPGAGTRRTVRRRKPEDSDFTIEPRSNNEEAFFQWRDAMRAMARLDDGIPPQFRRRIWLALADHQIVTQRLNWPRLVRIVFNGQMNPDDDRLGRQIVKDLHRTGCDEIGSEEDRAALKRVLLAYARWNKRVGYCQGFNILAAVILNVMERDEEAAFKIMVYLIDYVLPESYFAQNLQALSVDVAVFRDLLQLRNPDLANHLSQLQRSAVREANLSLNLVTGSQKRAYEPPLTNLYAIQWFLTLFATSLPPDCVHRVWDSILLEGSEVGLRAGLVVMDALHDDLMKLTSADQFYSSMSQWMEEFAEGYRLDSVEFMRRLYDMAPFPWMQLKQLREKYTFNINPFGEDGGGGNYENDLEEKQQRKVRWWRKARKTEEKPVESLPLSSTKPSASTADAKTTDDDRAGDDMLSEEPLASPVRSSPGNSQAQHLNRSPSPDLCVDNSSAKTKLIEDPAGIAQLCPGSVAVVPLLPTEPAGRSTEKPSRKKLSQTRDELSELEAAYNRHRMQKMAVDLNAVSPLQVAAATDGSGFASNGGLASSVLAPPTPAEKQLLADWGQSQNESSLPLTLQPTTVHPLCVNEQCVSLQPSGQLYNASEDIRQFDYLSDSSLKPSSTSSSLVDSSSRLLSPPQQSTARSKSPCVTAFHFDESVLEIINEWQQRNAALSPDLQSEAEPEATAASEGASQSGAPSGVSSPSTLLSLAARARGSNINSPETPSKRGLTSAALHALMAKTVQRDRQRAKEHRHSDSSVPAPSTSSPNSLTISPRPPSLSSMALNSPKGLSFRATSPPPPWAAALASISASRTAVIPSSRNVPKTSSIPPCPSTSVCPIPVKLSSNRRGFGEKFGLYRADFAKEPSFPAEAYALNDLTMKPSRT